MGLVKLSENILKNFNLLVYNGLQIPIIGKGAKNAQKQAKSPIYKNLIWYPISRETLSE